MKGFNSPFQNFATKFLAVIYKGFLMIGNSPTTLAYYISFDFVLLFNIPSRFHFYIKICFPYNRCSLLFSFRVYCTIIGPHFKVLPVSYFLMCQQIHMNCHIWPVLIASRLQMSSRCINTNFDIRPVVLRCCLLH